MKTLSYLIAVTAVLLACVSCDKITVGNSLKRSDTMKRSNKQEGDKKHTTLLTAVCFDDSYDWRKDSDYGHAKGHILLIKGEETILSLEAGGGSGISTAADRHHFSGGHLYSEYFNGVQTVYKRDGEECFRANGQEIIRGILTREDLTYVLSDRIPERGFVLREEWTEIMSRKNGSVHGSPTDPAFGRTGALYEDEGALCFAYFKKNQGPGQWVIVADGEEKDVNLTSSVSKIYDLRRFNGDNNLVYAYSDGRAPFFLTEGRTFDLSKSLGGTIPANDYRLYLEDGLVTVRGTFDEVDTGIWFLRELKEVLHGECSLHDGDSYISRVDGAVESLYIEGRGNIYFEKNYRLMMPGCAEWKDGQPILALTPENQDDKPAIWENGQLKEFDFNGYFTSVTIIE